MSCRRRGVKDRSTVLTREGYAKPFGVAAGETGPKFVGGGKWE